MSMYNLLFGEGQQADVLLKILGISKYDCGRYRDCFINNGKIVIHTRNGGGNREDYEGVFEELSKHPNYLYNEDDDFDCTYANIYFSIPEQYNEILSGIEESPMPAKKWQLLFNKLNEED